MISLHACPRCQGAVVEYRPPAIDTAMCVNCGWRRAEIPTDVEELVAEHVGKPYLEDRYTHHRIGTGKPPLSGWDRIKRSRERETRLRGESAGAAAAESVS